MSTVRMNSSSPRASAARDPGRSVSVRLACVPGASRPPSRMAKRTAGSGGARSSTVSPANGASRSRAQDSDSSRRFSA